MGLKADKAFVHVVTKSQKQEATRLHEIQFDELQIHELKLYPEI